MKKIFCILLTLIGLFSFISCEEKIDYIGLGFKNNLEQSHSDIPYFSDGENNLRTLSPVLSSDNLTWWNRVLTTDPNHPDYNIDLDYDDSFDVASNYLIFDETKIKISLNSDLSSETSYYFDWKIEKGVPDLTFGKVSDDFRIMFIFFQPYVDIFESNGVYSYGLRNITYNSGSIIQDSHYDLFWCLKNYKNLPYSVYFNNEIIFLVSKNSKFDRKALNLDKTEGIYLFRK